MTPEPPAHASPSLGHSAVQAPATTASPAPATPSKSKPNTKVVLTETSATPAPAAASAAVTPKRTTSSSTSSASSSSSSLASSATNLWNNYNQNTAPKLKLLDGFQLFLMLSGIAQFLYCLVITTFPFNAFISGFAATVGQFVLTAALRAQVNPKNKTIFPTISPERAFADYVFGSMLLHFFVYNYLG
ncbi:BZ3500_MvSof-1268-A1-R1_Chr2-1g04332 [Microbotryum saponariae]|uniref:Dolichyl-diphosphooligosaccharide--protein glycosyltransferase subunit OST2 n=1 Tax=Microbotryum saponariae TaxID=289078 RepID=A0A2X0KAE8_9BASI|nr:BZ3500_MvSof-1268-A1-R1_Chr2-1g04332 [Microbotryum saponariae]SCZ91459.1 BZ3501_MvSof-1269-A2-R1_Chr2-1g03988 [Microbotryum saponariae]